jgi:hypothetical protein
MAQRIDLEPLYTALKATIGENWAAYKEAISLFILGKGSNYSESEHADVAPFFFFFFFHRGRSANIVACVRPHRSSQPSRVVFPH